MPVLDEGNVWKEPNATGRREMNDRYERKVLRSSLNGL